MGILNAAVWGKHYDRSTRRWRMGYAADRCVLCCRVKYQYRALHCARPLQSSTTADGSMFLNGTPFPADAENLRAIIFEKTGSRRDIPGSIVADGDTRHAMVVMSMDTVSQLGFKRLSISTQRPAAGE